MGLTVYFEPADKNYTVIVTVAQKNYNYSS
jgi:hypothetical protein